MLVKSRASKDLLIEPMRDEFGFQLMRALFVGLTAALLIAWLVSAH